MPIIQTATEKIANITVEDFRQRCACAFYDSLVCGDPHSCNHPNEIQASHGIPIDTQVNLLISLPKDSAIVFLDEMHRNVGKKDFSEKKFQQKFGSKTKPAKRRKALVFSYGQILHLVQLRVEIPFPQELIEFLPEGYTR